MDRRREPRFSTSQPVIIRLLGENPATLPGFVQDISGKGMRLFLDRSLPLDSAVRVDLGKSILLGEVCYSRPVNEGHIVGLMVDQALHVTAGLRPLLDAVSTGAPVGPQPALRPPHRSANEAHAILSDK